MDSGLLKSLSGTDVPETYGNEDHDPEEVFHYFCDGKEGGHVLRYEDGTMEAVQNL